MKILHRARPMLVVLILATTGCVQLHTTVRLNKDGSATITERMRISKYLLDLDVQEKEAGASFAQLLGKEEAVARSKKMGKGATLTSHGIKDAEGGSREAIAVYTIPDLNDFEYMSPFLAVGKYPDNNRIKFLVSPILADRYGRGVGKLTLTMMLLTKSGKELASIYGPKRKRGEAPPKGPSPRELQIYRDLGPVFRDVMQDFQVRMTVETYAPIGSSFGVRNHMAGVHEVDVLNFSHKDLDMFGSQFLDNEELMLDLVRWDLGSQDISENVKSLATNRTVPVFLSLGSEYFWNAYKHCKLYVSPSRPLFDRYFTGKTLDYGVKTGKFPATFERIGIKKRK